MILLFPDKASFCSAPPLTCPGIVLPRFNKRPPTLDRYPAAPVLSISTSLQYLEGLSWAIMSCCDFIYDALLLESPAAAPCSSLFRLLGKTPF